MNVKDVLNSDPEVMSGAIVFKGTRVPVDTLFAYLRAGDPLAVFLSNFPTVERAQVEAVLELVADDLKNLVERAAT